jgi:NADH-quinone oxidoreductase subunit J
MNSVDLILGSVLILSSLGVILLRNPVHAALSFLLTLITLSIIYLQFLAQFVAAMQILVYAGAILVIFMFVIILFQDAHQQIAKEHATSSKLLIYTSGILFLLAIGSIAFQLASFQTAAEQPPNGFGTVESLGKELYLNFFFPFEAVSLLFLIAAVGAFYIGRKEKT